MILYIIVKMYIFVQCFDMETRICNVPLIIVRNLVRTCRMI